MKTKSRRQFLQAALYGATATVFARAASAQTTETLTTATLPAAPPPPAPPAGDVHRIIAANILLDSVANRQKPTGWPARRELCFNILKSFNPHIICTQEVLPSQNEDLVRGFPDFATFGFPGPVVDSNPGDHPGVTKNVILYRKDRYEMTSAGNFWLSESPLIAGSKSWDTKAPRHLNWVRLRDKSTGREFRMINTHFDHMGQTARENMARMVNEESAQYPEAFPQFLAGDFNANIENPAIKTLFEGGWKDTYVEVHGPEDPGRTFHGLEGPAFRKGEKGQKIDFVFYRGNARATGAGIIRDHEKGLFPSDHYFVYADILLT